jgi:hypothetical protein
MQLAIVVARLTRLLAQVALMLVFFGLFLRVVFARAFPTPPLLVLAAAPLGVNLLQLALSRAREAEADLEAAELTGDPYGLASALVKMRNQEQMLLHQWSPTARSSTARPGRAACGSANGRHEGLVHRPRTLDFSLDGNGLCRHHQSWAIARWRRARGSRLARGGDRGTGGRSRRDCARSR